MGSPTYSEELVTPGAPTPKVAPDECRNDAKSVGRRQHILVC